MRGSTSPGAKYLSCEARTMRSRSPSLIAANGACWFERLPQAGEHRARGDGGLRQGLSAPFGAVVCAARFRRVERDSADRLLPHSTAFAVLDFRSPSRHIAWGHVRTRCPILTPRSRPCRRSTAGMPRRRPRWPRTSANSASSVRAVRVEVAWLHRAGERAGHSRGRSVRPRDPRRALRRVRCLLGGRRGARQGDRAHDQPRRQGGRVLAEGALRESSGNREGRRVHPLRLHVRGHQQPGVRRDAWRGARGSAAPGAARYRDRPARAGPCPRRGADALAHARPAGDADHARQGDGQRLRAARAPDRRHRARAAQRQGERRRRQLQRARRRLSRRRMGAPRGQGGHGARPRVQPVHDADRAARLHGGAVRRHRARQHGADRSRSRRLGLHRARLLPAARDGRRGRLVDDAAQGQSDRLREFRGQPGARQCAPAAHGGKTADLALAARPVRFDGVAQRRRRVRPHAARIGFALAGPLPASPSTRRASRRTSTPTGRCWRSRSRR